MENISKPLNDLCRHQMIERIYRDILTDMAVCDIEGWDKTEYINLLLDMLNQFVERKGKK